MKLRFRKRIPVLDPEQFRYEVENDKGETLGFILYAKNWKKIVWIQEEDYMMSAGCLQQVVDKMRETK